MDVTLVKITLTLKQRRARKDCAVATSAPTTGGSHRTSQSMLRASAAFE